MIHTHEFEVGGKALSLEYGASPKQAGGAVLLGMGETVVLGTATMSENAREGIDFLPLVCDYEERKYAVGKIPGGFIKRGGRPSEKGRSHVATDRSPPSSTVPQGTSQRRSGDHGCRSRSTKRTRPMF